MFNWYRLINVISIVLSVIALWVVLNFVKEEWQPFLGILYIVMGGFHALILWEERKNPWWVKK